MRFAFSCSNSWQPVIQLRKQQPRLAATATLHSDVAGTKNSNILENKQRWKILTLTPKSARSFLLYKEELQLR